MRLISRLEKFAQECYDKGSEDGYKEAIEKERGWLKKKLSKSGIQVHLKVILQGRGGKFAVKFAQALAFKPMSEESKQELVSNYFSEDWAQKSAMMMLDDYEKFCSKS